jgi:pimeloyl-ACP methyl ester carboxylesterase
MRILRHKRFIFFKFLLKFKIIIISLLLICSGCLSRYIYSDKEIEAHYAGKSVKPEFKIFNYKGLSLFHAIVGDSTKPLLVLIHGSPGAWYGYLNMLDDSALQSHFRIISLDRLGYFKSRNKGTRSHLELETQAASIEALIKHYNPQQKPYYLFGRSYGAPIAAFIAAHHNEAIAHLYMISPAMDPKTEKFFWFSPLGKWWVMRWFLPKALNTATDEKYGHVKEMEKLNPILPTLTCSTTVMTGTADWIADTSNFDYCKKELINAKTRFIKLNGVGHLINYERPDLIRSLLIEDATKPIIGR